MERFEHEIVGRVHVLRLHGGFLDTNELSEVIIGCLGAEVSCVVINFAGMAFMNSAGFGGLFLGLSTIQKRGGLYRCCELAEKWRDLVSKMKVAPYQLNYFETEAEAVMACREAAGESM